MEATMNFQRFFLSLAICALALATVGCASTQRTVVSDQAVADQIKQGLEAPTGPEGPFLIDIFANKGEVTLDGHVPSAQAKERAMDVAHTTQGVKDVKSFLSVR